ncbi:hypothetical protein APY03_1934 [Variovorax sp. WDL1]|nr:hypothetical protein APY03_1934 [Variovorax sp. WDL1]
MHHAAFVHQRDAQPARREKALAAVEDGVEHRPGVGHRAADDPQDLGAGGLLRERVLGLVDEPQVLDGDRGLAGEGRQQLDLALRRLAGVGPGHRDRADGLAVLQQRHAEHAAPVAGRGGGGVVGCIRRGVGDRHGLARGDHPAADHARVRWPGVEAPRVLYRRGRPVALAHQVHQASVIAEHGGGRAAEQPHRAVEDRLEDRLHVARRLADDAQHLADGGLVGERFAQLGGALLYLALQPCIRLAQLRGHAVELVGQAFELVAGADLDAPVEVAGADLRCACLQRAQRAHQRSRQEKGRHHRDQHRQHEHQPHALQHDVQRREGLGAGRLDEHRPAERRDRGMGRQHPLAGQVACKLPRVAGAGPQPCRYLRQCAHVGLLQHQADVGVGDQRAVGIDHVGQAARADPDARDHVPDELQVELGHRDAAAGPGGARERHVRLGAHAEVNGAEPGPALDGVAEGRLGRSVDGAAELVHGQP